MNYSTKHSAATKRPTPGYHDDYRDPSVEVEPNLFASGRYGPCFICRAWTEFRDMTHIDGTCAVCSEECRAQSLTQYEEARLQEKADADGASHIPGLAEVDLRTAGPGDLPPSPSVLSS